MPEPFTILIVCTGNVCRSPMAEALLKKQLQDAGLSEGVKVLSAGTQGMDGTPASSNSVAACEPYGCDLKEFRSRPLTKELCEASHLILCMEQPHRDFIAEHFPNCSDKVRMVASFVSGHPGLDGVLDPIGEPQDVYENVAQLINAAMQVIVEQWSVIKYRFYDDGKYIIAVGSDHRGFKTKEWLKDLLDSTGYSIMDCGTETEERCDHPEYAIAVGEAVSTGQADRGILACSSGHGMIISANKVPGVRAVLPVNAQHAKLSRSHNNANVLVLGSDYMDEQAMKEIIETWLGEGFLGGTYQRRINLISDYENYIHNPPGYDE